MQQFVDTPLWNRAKAIMSWDYYLGSDYRRGGDDVPYLAAPSVSARAKKCSWRCVAA
jgi:hypothetical protein